MNNMDRRDFAKSLGVKAGALSALAAAPVGFLASPLEEFRAKAKATTSDPGLLSLCKAILKQNLLAPGERMVVATGYQYAEDYVLAMMEAGAKLGAACMHVLVFPKFEGKDMVSGTTVTHAEIFAEADLIIDCGQGRPPKIPSAGVGSGKRLDHNLSSDRAYLMRPGSKVRWLSIGGGMSNTIEIQRYLFPTQAIRNRSIKGAEIFHNGKEMHVTCPHGTDIHFDLTGRTGHCQYGIADIGGRWDNFATALSAVAPVETSAEGKIVYVGGDDIKDINPRVVPESETITLTYGGNGQATKIDGGRLAREFEEYLGRTNHPGITQMAHVGYGTDPRIKWIRNNILGRPLNYGDLHQMHHNMWGTVMIALGKNAQYGGGPHANYSGLGTAASNTAPYHPHTALIQGASLSVDGVLLCDKGDLTSAAA
jgi:2,5-dihydroxypyridine 5,6-dioxygenase